MGCHQVPGPLGQGEGMWWRLMKRHRQRFAGGQKGGLKRIMGVCASGVWGVCEACSGPLPRTGLSSGVSALIHSFLSSRRDPLYSCCSLTPASL